MDGIVWGGGTIEQSRIRRRIRGEGLGDGDEFSATRGEGEGVKALVELWG